ncbi:phosphoglycerate mutase-like protein 1 isoform X1 [Cryptomeria japonica]|uniref:phosphoglycerate mutase-like protein 1 isoform X1 n=1 Tax=Cryptomeria japonica TaxID=3369 RepID=UPI0027DA6051|nr:phosphoglycerate mutase-like protein 1 isoform X1 [Cryptomeria japonica]XP_057867491.2 phosphoglycerate mutase-like protein 1 isoform X1 [Cryptomeria japonica]
MFETPDSSLYPLHCCKTLHMVRHAQGYHNVRGDKGRTVLLPHELFDASLTPLGWQQVRAFYDRTKLAQASKCECKFDMLSSVLGSKVDILRKQVAIIGIASRVELVVTSPLTRAMQTAVGVFGGGDYNDSDSSPPLMVAGAGKSDRAAISSSKCPPFLTMELCREHMGPHSCEQRKSISECQTLFPAIDFSLVETDEDVLWKPNTREKEYDIAACGVAFLNWLLTRMEKEIVVVSHKGFLKHTMALFGKDCHPLVRNEIRKEFKNCELRSFVVSHRSAIGTSVLVTNFSRYIPPVPDVPNHDDGEKNMENEQTYLQNNQNPPKKNKNKTKRRNTLAGRRLTSDESQRPLEIFQLCNADAQP